MDPIRADTEPLAFPSLTQLAAHLGVARSTVSRAVDRGDVQPWLHANGHTRYWSVAQVRRLVERPRGIFTRKEAREMARYLAEHGPAATAEHFGCSRSCLYRNLERYGIPAPVRKGAPGKPRRPAKVA